MMCGTEEWDGGGREVAWPQDGGGPPTSRPLPPGSPQLVVRVALLVGTELGQDHLEDPHEDQQVDLGRGRQRRGTDSPARPPWP